MGITGHHCKMVQDGAKCPPHAATLSRASAVVKIVWRSLASGNEGGLQLLVLGNNSLVER